MAIQGNVFLNPGCTYKTSPLSGFGLLLNNVGTNGSADLDKCVIPANRIFTVGFRFRTTTAAGTLFSIGNGVTVLMQSSKLRVIFGALATQVTLNGVTNLNDGNFHLVEIDFSASQTQVFVDGVSVLTSTSTYTSANGIVGDVVITILGASATTSNINGDIDDICFWSTVRNTTNYTVPTTEYNKADTDLFYYNDFNTPYVDTAAVGATILPGNAGIYYSPENWAKNANSAVTINGGAYFRTLFTGSSCTLLFDITRLGSVPPQILVRVNGSPSVQLVTLTSSQVVVTIPAAYAAAANYLEVYIKAISTANNRWNSFLTGVIFKGLILSSGTQTVSLPGVAPITILTFGDSITEGLRTLNPTAPIDTDQSDSTLGWASYGIMGRLLGAEIGQIGFSSSGIVKGGAGNVPGLINAYNLIFRGVARTFSSNPDLIVINEGTNDGASIVTQYTTIINALLVACPKAIIACMRPFNGTNAANVQAAVTAAASARAVYVDTTGISVSTADGLHPLGWSNQSSIGPAVAAKLKLLMKNTVTVNVPGFRPMY